MKRARAAVLSRRQQDPGLQLWAMLAWTLLAMALAFALLASGTARAQGSGSVIPPPATSAPTLPPGSGSDPASPAPAPNSRPNSADTPGGTARNGVAVPRANPDPGIVAPTPSAPSGMPVIRPPGTPGGDTTVVPK